ncbi:hypothetical protein CDO73_05725 [Saccharibacillus sp. O23]|uniref:DUF4386 domain-containing protein n=1 Tax=Saccharibacillus sp. O23 TaxID=2009338 RepID=UPI000B4E25CF|nr:DUF4386 domain-containing protein [Saccharibacillus sp. O23]OWR31971.1 hypothetical protein CDO73_05725 [Saccharibacillus sp. O23]
MKIDMITSQTRRGSAIASGVSLLVMAAAAAYGYGFVHGRLIVPNDPAVTAANLGAHAALFRTEILSWLLILACDVIAAWGLYRFFEPVNNGLSLLGAWLRLAYAALLGTALSFLASALFAAENAAAGGGADSVMLPLRTFEFVWSAGLVLFGIHLLVIGFLMVRMARTARAARWIGVLLQLAGVSYLMIHLCKMILPGSSSFVDLPETILSLPMAAGELALAVWLIARGGRRQGDLATSQAA